MTRFPEGLQYLEAGILTPEQAAVCSELKCKLLQTKLGEVEVPGCLIKLMVNSRMRDPELMSTLKSFGNLSDEVIQAGHTRIEVSHYRDRIPTGCPEGFDQIEPLS